MGGKQTLKEPVKEAVVSENYSYHPYSVRGFCRVSKSGKALNILIREADGELHLLTIAKADIIDAFKHGSQCCAIEYQLSAEEKKELKNNG